MPKSWTIKTSEGQQGFDTPQEAAEYLKGRRGKSAAKAAPVAVVPEYSSRAAKVDEFKAEALPTKKQTVKHRAELTEPSKSAGSAELDFSHYSIAELDEIIKKANEAKRTFVDRRRAQLLAELEALDAFERANVKPRKKTRQKEAKARSYKIYQDENGQIWRGVGRKPGWLIEKLAAGANLEDFLRQK